MVEVGWVVGAGVEERCAQCGERRGEMGVFGGATLARQGGARVLRIEALELLYAADQVKLTAPERIEIAPDGRITLAESIITSNRGGRLWRVACGGACAATAAALACGNAFRRQQWRRRRLAVRRRRPRCDSGVTEISGRMRVMMILMEWRSNGDAGQNETNI